MKGTGKRGTQLPTHKAKAQAARAASRHRRRKQAAERKTMAMREPRRLYLD